MGFKEHFEIFLVGFSSNSHSVGRLCCCCLGYVVSLSARVRRRGTGLGMTRGFWNGLQGVDYFNVADGEGLETPAGPGVLCCYG